MSIDRIMELKDEGVQRFITDVVDSLVKLDIVIFFHERPDRHALEDISLFMGRRPENIAGELEELVEKGIVKKDTGGGKIRYHFCEDGNIRGMVESFINTYNDYVERLKIICTLLKNDAI